MRLTVWATIGLCLSCWIPPVNADNARLNYLRQRHISGYHARWSRSIPASKSFHSDFRVNSSKQELRTDEVEGVPPCDPAEPLHSSK